uniref:Carbonic anhydrase n=1 Tax=Porphyridium purpureum TaxID=35688 RepID=Q43060_PORPP|nr:carbonic anhydrase [Porphyridium purpureum]BAA92829.1 carbonic anhydrase [Porphyridium purpureum]
MVQIYNGGAGFERALSRGKSKDGKPKATAAATAAPAASSSAAPARAAPARAAPAAAAPVSKPTAEKPAVAQDATLVKLAAGMGVMSDLEKKFIELEAKLVAQPAGQAMPGKSNIFANNEAWRQEMLKQDPEFFNRLANGQSPEYLWIGCADSRVPANQLLDLPAGEVFVHRNIANQCIHSDISFLSVLQYAVQYLKVKHILVCGHYGCGGAKAALGDSRLGLIDNWLRHIRDVRRMNAKYLDKCKDGDEELNRLIELNVLEQVHNVCATSIVQDAWDAGQELTVQGVVYGVGDGKLRDLGVVVNSSDDISKFYRTKSDSGALKAGNPNAPLVQVTKGGESELDSTMEKLTAELVQQTPGKLKEGANRVFVNNENWRQKMLKQDPQFFSNLAHTQTPEILWIGCADSRVPANQIINLPAGEVFVHRNIANQCIHSDMSFLSVLQYAVQYLKVKRVVVCGHYACGGCAAALGDSRLGLIDNWLRHIRDVRRHNQAELSRITDPKDSLNRLIEINVLEQMHNVCATSIVQDAWDAGQELEVQGVVYGVGDGKLRDMGVVAKANDDIGQIFRTKQ